MANNGEEGSTVDESYDDDDDDDEEVAEWNIRKCSAAGNLISLDFFLLYYCTMLLILILGIDVMP